MKYLKRINIKEINTKNIQEEIKESYQKGKNYYEEIEAKQNNTK